MRRIVCYFATKKQTNMITPMTVWAVTAVSVAAIIIIRIIALCHKLSTHDHHNIFEIGSERSEFWIPGDPDIDTEDSDYDEFEDL